MHPLPLAEQPASALSNLLTREIFGNIPRGSQAAFYLLAALASAAFAYGIYRRVRIWRLGRPGDDRPDWRMAGRQFLHDVLFQGRLAGSSLRQRGEKARGLASRAHVLLFGGFILLLIGTTLIAIEHLLAAALGRTPAEPVFHRGVYFGVFELTMDAAGMALLAGCGMFAWRKWHGRDSFSHRPADWAVLLGLIAIGITGYVVEGLRLVHAQTSLPGLSPIGYVIAQVVEWFGTSPASAGHLHYLLWWGHAWLALGLIALLPYSRLLHALAGALNLTLRDAKLGYIRPVDMEKVEQTGTLGVGRLGDFTWQQLVELDACVSCGRCEDACPAFEAGKPLSPRVVVQEIAAHAEESYSKRSSDSLHGDTIRPETLWSCTACTACADVCPLGISPVRMITDMRQHLIVEGGLRGPPATALQKSQRSGNPWGLPTADRLNWADGLNVPTVTEFPDFEILYWVGCAAAYDRRIQNVARSFVQLLQAADVKFAVLGPAEKCTGEAARRMGDELLFQQLASENVATLQRHEVKQIVSHCPHCVNSFRQDYPQLGGQFEVQHHSELLANLLADGRLKPAAGEASAPGSITYHDPCYLARVQDTVDEPRAVLSAVQRGTNEAPLKELPRHARNTACCGGGGGRMWFDDAPDKRIGRQRVEEVVNSAASTVAVSCPFCLTMLRDGLAAQTTDVEVRDIAELLADALPKSEK